MSAVGHRYATALFELCEESGLSLSEVQHSLKEFCEVWAGSRELQVEFQAPEATVTVRRAIVKAIADKVQVRGKARDFLLLLSDKGRLDALEEIETSFAHLVQKKSGKAIAMVTSAAPLSDKQESELKEALEKLSGKSITLSKHIDETLIAGLVCEIDGRVLDGSLKNRLNTIREDLLRDV